MRLFVTMSIVLISLPCDEMRFKSLTCCFKLRVQSYDKARDLAVSEISHQERTLLASTRGRRSSSPGPAIRALIHEQLSADKQKWKEKFTSPLWPLI